MRVVLYAEGGGETSGLVTSLPVPGGPLTEDSLGPAHILLRRTIEFTKDIPVDAVQFESPLRTRTGRVARGSDFLDRTTVRQLLTWIVPTLRPDLVVVLVDRNAEQGRKQRIQRYVANIVVPKVIGVATKEFEAWLISDHPTIGSVLGNSPPQPTLPERMNSGEAKNVLREWGALFAPQLAPKDIRLAVARNCDLNELSRRSRSFRSFVHNLRHCAV